MVRRCHVGAEVMIEFRNVSKVFNGTIALHPTTLEIEKEKTTVLIGPSGCGKSTLLKLAMGLIEPSSGEIIFDGTKVTKETVETLRRRMGYVIQDGGLFPHLTGEENVTLAAKEFGLSKEEIRKKLDELCELTHFPRDGLKRYPAELSGGQRQRLSLMRGLILDPQVLLLDEPLGALDPMVRASLQTDLKEIFKRLGKTVLMVTHDMGEAAYFADVIVLMNEGRVVQKGSLEDLTNRPVSPFVNDFLRAQRTIHSL